MLLLVWWLQPGEKKESRTLRAAVVDRKFFSKLRKLLDIAVPCRCPPLSTSLILSFALGFSLIAARVCEAWYCEETGYLSVLLVFLIGRTFLSIKISEVNGSIVKAIVERNLVQFLARLGVLASIAVPASTINSMLKYLGNKVTTHTAASICFPLPPALSHLCLLVWSVAGCAVFPQAFGASLPRPVPSADDVLPSAEPR